MKVHNPNNLPTAPIADLLPTQGDLKDLTDTNYKKLKNVIERRGFSYPVYVWEDSKGLLHLLDGHQRQRVLTTEGWNDPIPYLKVPAKDLQEAAARLLEITSQYATITQEGIDEFIAKYELNEAEVLEATAFDATRFQTEDEPNVEVEEDEALEVSDEPPVSKLGEIYQLGRHRVMCGDSTDKANVELLMDGDKADMVLTDPPYGVDYDGISNDSRSGLATLLQESFTNYAAVTQKGGAFYCFHSDKCADIFHGEYRKVAKFSSMIIWVKPSLVLSQSDYHSRHEPCFYGWFEGASHSWNSDRKQTTVYEMGKESVDGHTTPKPIELLSKLIQNSSEKNDTVLDLFLGSGSTLIACEQTDRTCYGMELDPKYVDVIRKRYAKFVNDGELPDNWEELTPKVEV